ncbi:MAG: adenylate/guanylate cyclase domain-containing protein [Alphaproteobacteria bacterium]|nr:adenylate/guanylate cyclase domain-containing protein [Alphaproteobacteria bacterium]
MAQDGVTRRLTTILAADVVGYSRLMAADEEATLATLKAYREVMDSLVDKHRGRLVGTAGDAVLVEFGSAVEAVRCAISIQEDLAVRNAERPDDRKMLWRIGINVGDVMVDDDDLFGDGVNVAARLEGLAEPGGICISGSTFEQVKNKLSIGFEDIGPQEVKNIPHPVSTFRLIPGPVSVVADSKPAPTAAEPPAEAGRWRIPAMWTAAAVVILAGGYAAFSSLDRGSSVPTPLPDKFSTDYMSAKDIERVVTGMNIQGTTRMGSRPFTIRLSGGGVAKVEVIRPSGEIFRDTGKWWTRDARFCMKFDTFAFGRNMCPRIARDSKEMTATRPNGAPLDWKISR